MACLRRLTRHLSPPLKTRSPPLVAGSAAHTFISDMHDSTFKGTLFRMLGTYISVNRQPWPTAEAERFKSFRVEDHLGKLWVQLHYHHPCDEKIKIDITMLKGGLSPSTKSGNGTVRRHILVLVEISKEESSDLVLNFICLAWPGVLSVERVYAAVRGVDMSNSYVGRQFRGMNNWLQDAMKEYLDERGINDELAEFLYDYMIKKERSEFVGWLKDIESYIHK